MKKTYIAPALKAHQIGIESDILVGSPYGKAIFGNRGMRWEKAENSYKGEVTSYDVSESIDVIEGIEGDDWSTL